MKLTITAKIRQVNKVEPLKGNKGFTQSFVIEQPETKDEYQRVTQHGQIFLVNLFQKEITSKFLDESAIGEIRTFSVWLKGEEYTNEKGKVFHFLKLSLL